MKLFKTYKTIPALLLASTLVFAQHPKIAKDLERADPSSMVDVIIQFKHPPTEAHHQKIRSRGGVHKKSLDLVNGSLYSVPAGKLKELADDPDVVRMSRDHEVRGMLNQTAPAVTVDIAFQYGWTGAGVGIAILDSGASDSHDLNDNNGNNGTAKR